MGSSKNVVATCINMNRQKRESIMKITESSNKRWLIHAVESFAR